MSRVMPVLAPLPIAGLPDCSRKFALTASTNIGSAFRLADEKAGAAPAPKNRLLFPEKSAGEEFGARYVSPGLATTMLSTAVTAADAEMAPESLLARAPQS